MSTNNCACCGASEGIEQHHLYLQSDGCPDDLTVPLCNICHGTAHGMKRRVDIRQATREGLARAKMRGVNLGGPRIEAARGAATEALKAGADQRAANVLPIIQAVQASGATSLRNIAEALNVKGVRTARGGKWHASSVRNVLARAS